MEAQGTIKYIADSKRFTENFRTQEMVLTMGENTPYPQHITFTFVNDNCVDLIYLNEGDEVTLQFNLRGNYGKDGKGPYNKLEVWKIKKTNAE